MVRWHESPAPGSEWMFDVHAAYQPIVDLRSGRTVGYEALARWPDRPHAAPESVFAEARRVGVADQVEWACRMAAIRGARDGGLARDHTLFVNVEVDTTPGTQPEDAATVIVGATVELRVVIEVTERALLSDPARLLTTIAAVRSMGYGIALDDVGSNPDSLTVMELLAPDVVKLDRRLVQGTTTDDDRAIVAAVGAYRQRGPATILAEGIETADHLARARDHGATLGQGWLFGPPAALPALLPGAADTTASVPFFHSDAAVSDPLWTPTVPSELFARIAPRIADEDRMRRLMRHVLEEADASPEALSVLVTTAGRTPLGPEIADLVSHLASTNPFVAVLGTSMSTPPAAHVRSVALDSDDPLHGSWVVTVVGHRFFSAVIGREKPGTAPERRFEYAVTDRPDLVTAAARSLASRMTRAEGILPPMATLGRRAQRS